LVTLPKLCPLRLEAESQRWLNRSTLPHNGTPLQAARQWLKDRASAPSEELAKAEAALARYHDDVGRARSSASNGALTDLCVPLTLTDLAVFAENTLFSESSE